MNKLKGIFKGYEHFYASIGCFVSIWDEFTEYNKLIIDDFLLLANQNLFASSTNIRVMALAIYSHAANLKPDIVLISLVNKIDSISKN